MAGKMDKVRDAALSVMTFLSTGWRKWLGEHVLAPLITGIVVAVALIIYGPTVAENVALRNPTCEDPQGSKPLPREEVESAQVSASGTQMPDSNNPEEQHVNWDPANVIDGEDLTFWVPPDIDTDSRADPPSITVTLDRNVDLALVCVVSGFQFTASEAQRADRLRTVEVVTDEHDSEVTFLPAVGGPELQNARTLRIDKGHTREVEVRIIDVYPGQAVEGPSPDQPLLPTHHTTIGEIYLFEKDPDVGWSWPSWWPFD